MAARDAQSLLKRWRQKGARGFFAWIRDVRPMIPDEHGGFQPYEIPNKRVRAEITKALSGLYSTIVFCWPRRHGKSLVVALIHCWRFLTRKNQTIAIVANSTTQVTDTAYKFVRQILENTPYTRKLIDDKAILVFSDRIEYPAAGNVIQGFASNAAALFGKKLSAGQVSELHATASDAVYQAIASGTIDSEDGMVLVDSTVGPRASPLFGLYQLFEKGADPQLYFSHIDYADIEGAIANGPAWIRPERLRSRAAQMLPQEFAQQHLNQWTAGTSSLFPPAILDKCRDKYPIDVTALADSRPYAVGAGLDRAYGFSLHGDATVCAAVLKVLEGDEEHFYVLDCSSILFSSASGIKKAFTRYYKDFGLKRATLESYNVQDVQAWASEQPFESETVSATAEKQSPAFTAVYNAAAEGRLHIAPHFEKLFSEMATLEYRLDVGQSGTVAKFQHAKGCHDDHVYALVWAVHSLRQIELNPYELPGISCHATGAVAQLCILNGGAHAPACSGECRSFQAMDKLYGKYKERSGVAHMGLNDFFRYKIVNTGSHSVRR